MILAVQSFKWAIGWNISDIFRIPPKISTHKIQLELECFPSIEHQYHLNPPTQEVVKKDIIMWLNASVVYPIANNKWVRPI